MNTRAIIQFLENGVLIMDEYRVSKGDLITKRIRCYYFDRMTVASFLRLTSLCDHSPATIHLKVMRTIKQVHPIIYWKREGRRVYHGRV